jgi:hypothetical protein
MDTMTIEQAIRRERIRDALVALQYVNIAQLPGESYEDNLKRRAELNLRQDRLLAELAG